jgi:NAD(P)-dependent dehydrogenase (short-subunit alcohol dehydrogenase family)
LEMCRQLANGDIYSNIYALCRKSNDELSSLARSSKQNVVVVENVEVMKDESIDVVQTAFSTTAASPVPIHLLVHNAGAYGPPEEEGRSADGMYKSQTLDNVTMERMRFAYELNTLAPLRLTKALLPNLEASQCDARKDPSKLIIISSAMGSIAENGSGGHYGYRAAKAGANMIGKNLSVDLKPKNVAVGMSKKKRSSSSCLIANTGCRKLTCLYLFHNHFSPSRLCVHSFQWKGHAAKTRTTWGRREHTRSY